jgi:hypothetical protein
VLNSPGTDGDGEVAESVRALLSKGGAHEEVKGRRYQAVMDDANEEIVKPKPKTKFTQMSMDRFATRQAKYPATQTPPPRPQQKSTSNQPITIDSSPISPSLPPPISPSKRTSSHDSPPLRPSSPSPTHPQPQPQKKKLFIPRTSAVGFFETIEVEQNEVDDVFGAHTRRLEARGVRAGVVRWSDVSEIDLTKEDDDWNF